MSVEGTDPGDEASNVAAGTAFDGTPDGPAQRAPSERVGPASRDAPTSPMIGDRWWEWRPTSRIQELRATTTLLALATISAFAYVLLTPDGPNRAALRGLVGSAVIVILAINRLATPAFADRARRGVGGLITVGSTVAWVTSWVAFDGGVASPLNATFMLPLGVAVVGTPSAAPIVGAMVIAGHLAGSALGGTISPPTSLLWVTQFVLLSIAISWVSSMRVRQRSQLRGLTQELELLAIQDPLTRTLNRRGLTKALATFGEDGEKPAALLVADLDHFKAVNDRFGHATGDEVLVAVARAIDMTVRDGDLVARTGGEEFAVVLRDADRATAETVAERIRSAVARCHEVTVTASIGLVIAPDTGTAVERLHLASDRAMYLAKQQGRDRVVVGHLGEVTHPTPTPPSGRLSPE